MKLVDRIRKLNRRFRKLDNKTRRQYPNTQPLWLDRFQALRRLVGDLNAINSAEKAETLIDLF